MYLKQIYPGQCAKVYKNWLGFVDDVIKHFGVFFGSQVQLPFTHKTRTLSLIR